MLAASLVFSALFMSGSVFLPFGIFSISRDALLIITVSLAVPMLSFGAMDYKEQRRIHMAEKRLPDLLRDLSNFTSFGVPLSEAFQRVGGNSYGVLTGGVRRVSSLITAGISFEEAIEDLGANIRSNKIGMVSKILQKSNESGSNTSDVIWILSDFTSRSELLKESRIGEIKNYDLVMIVSFAVFLFVILFLDIRFLQIILHHSVETGSFVAGNLSSFKIENAFSVGVVVQALAIGLISGILRDVRLASGILLSGILLASTITVFLIMGVF